MDDKEAWRARSTSWSMMIVLVIAGCDASNEDGLTKTRGVIHVDGRPAMGVVVKLYPESGAAAIAQGTSGDDGSFQVSTNVAGDGVVPGKYSATMVWSRFDPLSRSQTGDRLGGLYADPAEQAFLWDIPATGDFDAGTIELSMP